LRSIVSYKQWLENSRLTFTIADGAGHRCNFRETSMAVTINCPSCGVSIEGTSAHTRSMSCPHCGNWVYFGSNGWESAGLFKHAIDAPSMLQLGKSGTLSGRQLYIDYTRM